MKKFGLFILSIVAILGIGVSFADVIYGNPHTLRKCTTFENVEIDNYRLIVVNVNRMGRERWEIYEPKIGECLHGNHSQGYEWWGFTKEYLLDKSIDINDLLEEDYKGGITVKNIPQEELEDKIIWVGDLDSQRKYFVDESDPRYSYSRYRIIKDGGTYQFKRVKHLRLGKKDLKLFEFYLGDEYELRNEYDSGNSEECYTIISEIRFIKFGIIRILTVLIETIVLFIIAKLFRKKEQISNWRLILIGILASTITLPLLRFVFPLFVTDETVYVIIGELSVTILEVFVIKYGLKVSWGKAILASVICNLCSFLLGLLVF